MRQRPFTPIARIRNTVKTILVIHLYACDVPRQIRTERRRVGLAATRLIVTHDTPMVMTIFHTATSLENWHRPPPQRTPILHTKAPEREQP